MQKAKGFKLVEIINNGHDSALRGAAAFSFEVYQYMLVGVAYGGPSMLEARSYR